MNIRNIELLELVADALGDQLNRQIVYIGGSTTALFVDPQRRSQVRQTKDVDIIVDVVTQHDYHSFCEQLKARGFQEDLTGDALICRFCLKEMPDIKLDGNANKRKHPWIRQLLVSSGNRARVRCGYWQKQNSAH